MTPEKEVRAILLGRVLYEELSKKGYSDAELKTAGAWLHDVARDRAIEKDEVTGRRKPRGRITDEQLAPTMKIIDGMRENTP